MTHCPVCRWSTPALACLHPTVGPFDGEPPTELGCNITDWRAENVRVDPTNPARVQVRRTACPGGEPKETR